MPADRRVVVLDSGEALADRLWAHATRRRPDAVKEENRFAFQTAALIFEAAAEELGESDAAAFSRRRRRRGLPARHDRFGDRGAARCERRVRVGELLSRAGRFQDARAVLNDAVAGLDGDGGDGASGRRPRGVEAPAASAVAERDPLLGQQARLGSPESLQLLLDSSQLAVLYLEDAVPRRRWTSRLRGERVLQGRLRLRPAGDRAFAYFRDAHASLARVPEALAGEPGGRVAAEAFYEAEFQLRAPSAAPEPSIYTFGNLSEAYLHVLHELPLGILHERKGCDVAVKALGADHPNAARKLAEFADVLAQIGMPDLAVGARRGAVPPPEELVGRLGRPPWDHILPEIARPRRVALRRAFARLGIPRSFWDDVGVPPAMVELAVDDHSDDDDMHAVASGLLMYNPDAPGHS
ncbi:hypothetical protein JL720_12006 [Aureococcus anophagefferens]|nr:hypothetical protein JL720_12006 [Aureococcus anophagefferens]